MLSSILFSLVSVGTAGDLAAISKHTESWLEVVGLLAWKTVQLAVCWYGDLDGMFPSNLIERSKRQIGY